MAARKEPIEIRICLEVNLTRRSEQRQPTSREATKALEKSSTVPEERAKVEASLRLRGSAKVGCSALRRMELITAIPTRMAAAGAESTASREAVLRGARSSPTLVLGGE